MLLSQWTDDLIEAGVDEAGRGCLAGPVVAAAVILPKNFAHQLLNDSKKLSAKQRHHLQSEIRQQALAIGLGIAEPHEIDEVNILQASLRAMHRALDALALRPELLLVDGKIFLPYQEIKHHCIVKGDGLYFSIAAASVIAKTHRDALMAQYAQQYPGYGWERNAGYPTRDHYAAIQAQGPCPLHRRSFRLY